MPFNAPTRYPESPRLFLKSPLGTALAAVEQDPDMTYFRILNRYVYIVHSPQAIKYILQENYKNYHKGRGYELLTYFLGKGLLTIEGEAWHRQRRLIQPAFHREKLQSLAQVTANCTMNLLREWQKREGETINFTQEMGRLTIDIVSRVLFGTQIAPDIVQSVWHSVNILNGLAANRLRSPIIWPFWLPLISNFKAKWYIEKMNKIMYGLIRDRRQNPTDGHDLLNMLLEARDEETGEGMNDRQLRDELMTIFVAGHETTVNALSWIWYCLKKNPDTEQRLRAENDTILGTQMPNFDNVSRMAYNTNVINEGMRLYPPAMFVGRKAMAADQICGYDIRPGHTIVVNIYGAHRNPKYWDKPNDFMPERFDSFAIKGDNRFVFLPFGGGPRICIGNNFAMLEMQIINALLARHVQFDLVSQHVVPDPQITLKPVGGVVVKLNQVTL
ncbi:MAG: cytochrome P450 [Chitinophagales bacterium]|nr:cytochrome P450 [Chitinophagales bacterium]